MAFYLSVFPDSELVGGGEPVPDSDMPVFDFRIGDLTLLAFNGGPHHEFNDAISLVVTCDTQDEIDMVWDRLTDEGLELMCGWVRDKFGVSWQIIPRQLGELLGDPDPERAKRALGAMMGMNKVVVADIEAAMNEPTQRL